MAKNKDKRKDIQKRMTQAYIHRSFIFEGLFGQVIVTGESEDCQAKRYLGRWRPLRGRSHFKSSSSSSKISWDSDTWIPLDWLGWQSHGSVENGLVGLAIFERELRYLKKPLELYPGLSISFASASHNHLLSHHRRHIRRFRRKSMYCTMFCISVALLQKCCGLKTEMGRFSNSFQVAMKFELKNCRFLTNWEIGKCICGSNPAKEVVFGYFQSLEHLTSQVYKTSAMEISQSFIEEIPSMLVRFPLLIQRFLARSASC